MPFVLRRTKQQVLSYLPPKIITDIVCELSPLQRQLYEDFAASAALSEVAGALAASAAAAAAGGGEEAGGAQGGKGSGHIFTALLYLRRLCSHPLLALDWQVGMAGAAGSAVAGEQGCVCCVCGVWDGEATCYSTGSSKLPLCCMGMCHTRMPPAEHALLL